MWIIKRFARNTKFFFKKIFWRLKFGFDITDTWNLDYSLAKWLEPRVRYLAKNTHGHPSDFTQESWCEYLIKIADGIDLYLRQLEDNDFSSEKEREAYKKYKEAMQMFTDRLHDMWD